MAVKVRLRRMGSSKRPFYRIVASDSRTATSGRFIEALGWYDPKRPADQDVEMNVERVAYWQECGAQLSDTVRNLFQRMKNKPASDTTPAPS